MSVTTYATLINQKVIIPSQRTNYVAVQKDHLIDFLRPFIGRVAVDAEWYLRTNPDIAEAVQAGVVASAEQHYVTSGYYEHRMPYEIRVDEPWYLAQYPDVKEAVGNGLFNSARDHYYQAGYREGRLPYAGFAVKVID